MLWISVKCSQYANVYTYLYKQVVVWSKETSLSKTMFDLVLQGGNIAVFLLIDQPQARKYLACGERRSPQLSKTVLKVLSNILLILSPVSWFQV